MGDVLITTLHVNSSILNGSLTLPSSKSHTLRALLFGAMGEGRSVIDCPLVSPDVDSMIAALRSMGAVIEQEGNSLVVEGVNGQPKCNETTIDAGNSGQVLRFVGALSALLSSKITLTGDLSIQKNRPIAPLLLGVKQLGATAIAIDGNGRPPISIKGPILAGKAKLCGKDSQPISGLLMATAFLEGTTQIEVENPGETPWIDLTISWLRRLGASIKHQDHCHYTILGPLRYKGFYYSVPGDLSSAAFPIAAALVTRANLVLQNIDLEDVQGDKAILDVLEKMGAHFVWDKQDKSLVVSASESLKGANIDCNRLIDALPILAVIGCFANEKVELTNAAIARKKESDRIFAMAKELSKMGAAIEEREDGLVIYPSKLKGAVMSSHNDHRVAMALSVAALRAEGPSEIEGVEVIAKSYPHFVRDFQNVGAKFAESHSIWI